MTRVADLMTAEPLVAVSRATTADEAMHRAERAAVHHLVVMKEGDLVGVLCTCDLRTVPGTSDVSACMSRHIVTIGPDADAAVAADRMRFHGIGAMPVVEAGRVVGIVTAGDFHRSGMPVSATGKCVCSACGGKRHVRGFVDDIAFCVECLDLVGYGDLGDGD